MDTKHTPSEADPADIEALLAHLAHADPADAPGPAGALAELLGELLEEEPA